MKKVIAVLLMQLLFAASLLFAQEKAAPQHKLVEFQMALLKRAPGWQEIRTTNQMALEKAQTN